NHVLTVIFLCAQAFRNAFNGRGAKEHYEKIDDYQTMNVLFKRHVN
mgnify:CR=1